MNTRQKKKQFKKIHGENPPEVDGIMRGASADLRTKTDPAAGDQKSKGIYQGHDRRKTLRKKKPEETLKRVLSKSQIYHTNKGRISAPERSLWIRQGYYFQKHRQKRKENTIRKVSCRRKTEPVTSAQC